MKMEHPVATMTSLRAKLGAVRAIQQRLCVVSSPSHWTTSTPAPSPPSTAVSSGRGNLPTFPSLFDGGMALLGGMEHLVVDFLDIPDLLVGAMVCKRWRDLCRHDGFWEKLLVTPAEGHALRPLLACSDSVPAMCVYMLFCQSGLRKKNLSTYTRYPSTKSISWSTLPQSIHVTASCDGKMTLSTWLANTPGPLSPQVLRSLCFQVLHGVVALEDTMGAKPRELAVRHIAVAGTAQVPASLDTATSSIGLPTARPPLVQLLAVDSHIESCEVPSAQYFDEREEAMYLLKFRGLPKKSQKWRGTTVAYLYLVLSLALHGRATQVQLDQFPAMPVLHVLAAYRHLLPTDITRFVEYGVYVRYHQTSPKPLLDHSYFTNAASDATHVDQIPAQQNSSPPTAYLEHIMRDTAWQELPHPTTTRPSERWPFILPPVWSDDATTTQAFHQQWMRQRWHSLSLPPDTTPASLALILMTQKHSLRQLDLKAASRLSSDTIVRALTCLPHLRELRLPPSMLRHGPLEAVVAALQRSSRGSSVHVVDTAMAKGLCALESAYELQLDMLSYSSLPSR